jgi:hypothetical protein
MSLHAPPPRSCVEAFVEAAVVSSENVRFGHAPPRPLMLPLAVTLGDGVGVGAGMTPDT